MAYITLANARKIVLKSKLANKNFEGNVYKQPIRFLNKYDENQLLAIQELLKNPEKYFNDYYEPYKVTDSFRYIYEEVQPSFHSDLSCPRLNANYQNFEIPDFIKEKGTDAILEFRHWFKSNIKLLEKPDLFVERLRLKFDIIYSPKSIEIGNSGVLEIESLSLEELENKIDSLLADSNKYFTQNIKHQIILEKYVKRTYLFKKNNITIYNETSFGLNEVKDILLEFENKFTTPLKKYLIEYYRLTHNPNLKINNGLLENIGFNPCQHCEIENNDKVGSNKTKPIQANTWKIVDENLEFFIKMYSIHYAFSVLEIQNLVDHLHMGSSYPSKINKEDEFLNFDLSDYGFYFNANIVWNSELVNFWANYLIKRSMPIVISNYSFPISQKNEIEFHLNFNARNFLSYFDPILDYDILNEDSIYNNSVRTRNLLCTNYYEHYHMKSWKSFKLRYYEAVQKDTLIAIEYYKFDQSEHELDYFFDIYKSQPLHGVINFIFDRHLFLRIHEYLKNNIEDFSVERLFLKYDAPNY
jgi:hypothetical protein